MGGLAADDCACGSSDANNNVDTDDRRWWAASTKRRRASCQWRRRQPAGVGAKSKCADWRAAFRPVDVCSLDELPYGFSEPAIATGYRRPNCSFGAAVLSAVYPLNNETVNFWTHFVPFWYFVGQLRARLNDEAFTADPYHWPFLVYMCTVCAWPLVSALAHLLNVLSLSARHLAYFCDYASLSWYSMGCGLAYHAYSFDRRFFDSPLAGCFPWLAAVCSAFCVWCACASRLIDRRRLCARKVLRLIGFAVPYLLVNGPLFARVACPSEDDEDNWLYTSTAVGAHRRQFVATAVALVIYSSHAPERLWPGRFDVLGNSHQLFHVCGVAATYFQLQAVSDDLRQRRAYFHQRAANQSSPIMHADENGATILRAAGRTDIFVCLLVLLVNLALVAHFGRRQRWRQDGVDEDDGWEDVGEGRRRKVD